MIPFCLVTIGGTYSSLAPLSISFFRKEQQERRKYQQGNARHNQATLQVTGSLLNQTDCVRSDKSTEICDRGN